MELSERKEKILAAVVEKYISTGDAIGSKLLLDTLDFSVSSATVRNEMSELASLGYLVQPHTSAGRIPTDSGFRYYIDNLMENYELSSDQRSRLHRSIASQSGDPEQILEQTAEVLSRITNCAAFVTTPGGENARIRGIELLPVASRTVLMVLMTSTGIVKSKLCRLDYKLTKQTAEIFYNISGNLLVGKLLYEINTAFLQTIASSVDCGIFVMSPLLAALADLISEISKAQVMIEGKTNLMHHRELIGYTDELMRFLQNDEPVQRLISSGKKEFEIKIGTENIFRPLKNTGVIISHYRLHGKRGGALGIIGPVRLDYARIIPYIKYISEYIEAVFDDILE